jgi:hypothetical protein
MIELMAGGLSFEACCGHLGVSKDTGYEWAKKYPEFAEAKEIGTAKSQMFWEEEAIKGRWGSKDSQFNSTVWIFTMKNRFGWRDKKEVISSGSVGDLYKDYTLPQVEAKIGELLGRLPIAEIMQRLKTQK